MSREEAGAAPVNRLGALPPEEAALVRLLRLWAGGPLERAEAWRAVAERMGPTRGRVWLQAFEALLGLLEHAGRRGLALHGTGCECVGADEAVLALVVRTAAFEAREDALLLAALVVRADAAPVLAELAAQVGRGLFAREPVAQAGDRRLH